MTTNFNWNIMHVPERVCRELGFNGPITLRLSPDIDFRKWNKQDIVESWKIYHESEDICSISVKDDTTHPRLYAMLLGYASEIIEGAK